MLIRERRIPSDSMVKDYFYVVLFLFYCDL